MTKLRFILGLAFFAVFLMGRLSVSVPPPPTYAIQPSDCSYAGMKATGWSVQHMYNGGINNGGISENVEYECAK